ncbi:MAG: sigma-54 dependent transcriptional regulator [Bryobacter sp.]|nr:sigma-54 dependent transcriptional regulator [Bryobacter sp.]
MSPLPNVEKLQFLGVEAILASSTMRELFAQVRRTATSGATVLLWGESGTGKEIVARALHHYSSRKEQAFVDLSCAALPNELVESELFGHERGAFSGAYSAKPGLLEAAHEGSLFLDEIGELDLRLQAKLLRFLDTGQFYRLGSVKQTKVNVRIIAATNHDLTEAVAEGRFRADLYHRLMLVPLRIPTLRERAEEITALANYFLAQQNPELRFAADALTALYSYSWPGNVRELRNTVLRSALLSKGPLLHADDLLFLPRPQSTRPEEGLRGLEPVLITRALQDAGGVRQRAADSLGMSRSTLSRKMRSYGLLAAMAAPAPRARRYA